MPTVKIGVSRQIAIPKKLHDALGLVPGDYLEIELYKGNRLLITPKELVDKDPEIDKQLEKAEADVKAGHVLGPFTTAAVATRALRSAKP